MSENNLHYHSLRAILAAAIIVPAILVCAGCVSPAPENTTPVISPVCSSDAGVCPVAITPAVRIDASPQMYTPLMSSTPGIGLTPNATGFKSGEAAFTWNTSYGQFFDWSPPNYTISERSPSIVNHGEKVYWSFTDSPASTSDPVIISVTARDLRSGQILGSSHLTLVWAGNFTVTVQNNTA